MTAPHLEDAVRNPAGRYGEASPGLVRWAAVALGLSFHVLATPQISGIPLRVALADLVLALTMAWLVITFVSRRSVPLPRIPWQMSAWLGCIFVLLTASYLGTGIHDDSSAAWARLKILGFVILSGYFVLGSWIASVDGTAGGQRVASGFIAGAWAASVLGIIEYAGYFYYDYPTTGVPRPVALAENPNAYGIMLTAALALDVGLGDNIPHLPKQLRAWGRIIMLVAIFLSASRSAYAGFIVGSIGLWLSTRLRVRQLIVPLVAAAALFMLLFELPSISPALTRLLTNPSGIATSGQRASPSEPQRRENFALSREHTDTGFRDRLDMMGQAVTMWREHPVFGAGLGSFWREQQARGVPHPYLNHSTALWFLSETGIVGLLIVAGGALAVTWTFGRYGSTVPLAAGVSGLMFVMLGASIGTEVMYQRYTWCFCGLALALVGQRRRHPTGVPLPPEGGRRTRARSWFGGRTQLDGSGAAGPRA